MAHLDSYKTWTPMQAEKRQAQLAALARAVWDVPAIASAALVTPGAATSVGAVA